MMPCYIPAMPKGVYPRKPRKPKKYDAALVRGVQELYGTGRTQAEIAAELGVTQKIVWRLMRHHGIIARPAVVREHIRGEVHPHWKGAAASYKAFHLRLRALYGRPRYCQRCGTTDPRRKYDWANLTGRYDDPADYERMCRHCHRQYDAARRRSGP